MIGRIRGVLVEKKPPLLVLDVQGVGYEIEAPMSTFYQLPELQLEVTLYTHLLVREDSLLLFGFVSENERRLFRALLKVNGIGARMALTILSGTGVEEFFNCIQTRDVARLTRLPGVGKKTAERLIVEMHDRLSEGSLTPLISQGFTSPGPRQAPDAVADAISALVALGYKPQEASRHVQAIDTKGMSSEAIIREALKGLARF